MSIVHQELLRLAERQLALAGAGRWEELPAAMEDFARRAAALPAVAPPSAADPLRRAVEVVARVEALLRAGRMDCARELSQLRRGRGAARSYAGGAGLTPGSQLDGTA